MFIMLYRENIKKIFLSKTTGQIWKRFGNCSPGASKIHSWMFDLKVNIKQSFLGEQPKALSFLFCDQMWPILYGPHREKTCLWGV